METEGMIKELSSNTDSDAPTQTVRFKQMCLVFLKKEKGVTDLCGFVGDIQDEKFLTLKSVDLIITAVWEQAFWTIMKFVFIPYMV
jgi:hypothetical protein